MKTGIKGEACTYVNSENTAAAMKSGTLDVFATPAVAALIEQACQEVCQVNLAQMKQR